MRIAPKGRLFWPLLVTLLLADCTTKQIAESRLAPSVPEPILGDFLRFTLAYNPGAALSISLGSYSRVIFSLVAVVAVVILARLYRQADVSRPGFIVAIALVMGGALGNLLDRLRAGHVIDFIDIGVGGWRFWTFNIADLGVSVGAVVLAWYLSRSEPAGGAKPA